MIKTVNFDFEYGEWPDLVSYTAVCDVDFFLDDQYGADADGNRGLSRAFINSVTICYVMDADGNHITNYDENFQAFVEAKAQENLEDE